MRPQQLLAPDHAQHCHADGPCRDISLSPVLYLVPTWHKLPATPVVIWRRPASSLGFFRSHQRIGETFEALIGWCLPVVLRHHACRSFPTSHHRSSLPGLRGGGLLDEREGKHTLSAGFSCGKTVLPYCSTPCTGSLQTTGGKCVGSI